MRLAMILSRTSLLHESINLLMLCLDDYFPHNCSQTDSIYSAGKELRGKVLPVENARASRTPEAS